MAIQLRNLRRSARDSNDAADMATREAVSDYHTPRVQRLTRYGLHWPGMIINADPRAKRQSRCTVALTSAVSTFPLGERRKMAKTEYIPITYRAQKLRIAANLRLFSDDLILFMHGFGCTKESFSGVFEQDCLRNFSLCAFDFPGHGASTGTRKLVNSMQSYADIANLLIEKLSPRRVFLTCHSMGGAVGLIASQSLRNIGCYISIEGNLVAEDCGIVSRRTAAQSHDEYVATGYREFVAELKRASRADYLTWARWCEQADPSALHESARSLVEWSDSGKLIELFTSLRNKAYIHGDEDSKQYLDSKLQKTPVYTIPGAGHFTMIDNPAEFYSILTGILLKAGTS